MRNVGIILLGLVALLFVVRPMMQRAFTQPLPPSVARTGLEGQPRTVADIESELHRSLGAQTTETMLPNRPEGRLPILARKLVNHADQEPEQIAKLMRTWLTEGDQ